MADNRDILFGQIALERGLVTQAQLDEALKTQTDGDGRQIGMLLIDAGHLQEDELEMVLTVQRERLARTAENSTAKLSDVLFGRLIVRREAFERLALGALHPTTATDYFSPETAVHGLRSCPPCVWCAGEPSGNRRRCR